jgi:hypothetical protein
MTNIDRTFAKSPDNNIISVHGNTNNTNTNNNHNNHNDVEENNTGITTTITRTSTSATRRSHVLTWIYYIYRHALITL